MDEPTPSPAARALAYGVGFAAASLLLQLLLPPTTTRAVAEGSRLGGEPGPFLLGGLLRVPLSLALGALVAAGLAPARATRMPLALASVFLVLLGFDAASYRWLGEYDDLLRTADLFDPTAPFAGTRIVRVGVGALLGVLVAVALGRALEPALERRLSRPNALVADGLTLGLFATVAATAVGFAQGGLALGATPPLAALVLRRAAPAPAEAPEATPADAAADEPTDGVPADVRQMLYHYLAPTDPEALTDASRPFCRPRSEPRAAKPRRPVVVVVMRGVDARDLAAGGPMPKLAARAGAAVSLRSMIASGDDPTQGLVSLLSSVHPLAPTRYDELATLPRLPSVPAALTAAGYRTEFVTTYDLSPGRERSYLAALGFVRVAEPSYADETAAGRMRGDDPSSLEAARAALDAGGATPFVVTSLAGAMAESTVPRDERLAALDGQLDAFLTAARARHPELLSIVVGDSPGVRPDTTEPLDFVVPCVLEGLDPATARVASARADVVAGLADLGPTVLAALGVADPPCAMGRDLFATDGVPPDDRRVVALSGEDQRSVWVYEGRVLYALDARALDGAHHVYDRVGDRARRNDLFRETDPAAGSVRDFVKAYLGVSRYLAALDRYVPGAPQVVAERRPPVESPVQLVPATAATAATFGRSPGRIPLLRVTLASGAPPMVDGQPLATVLAGLARRRVTGLALDIGMLDLPAPLRTLDATRDVVRAIESANLAEPPLMLPRDPVMATSLSHRTPYTVLVAVPTGVAELVETVKSFGADGLVMPSETPESVVLRARARGLRVALAGSPMPTFTSPDARPDYVLEAPFLEPAPTAPGD